jgi:hypothetical protein
MERPDLELLRGAIDVHAHHPDDSSPVVGADSTTYGFRPPTERLSNTTAPIDSTPGYMRFT